MTQNSLHQRFEPTTEPTQHSPAQRRLVTKTTFSIMTGLLLTGCHVSVTDVNEHEAGYDTEVTPTLARYDRIESLEGSMTGRLRMRAERSDLNYTNINTEIIELNSTDFRIEAKASVWLDDGWRTNSASLTTTRGVHWYQNDTRPHAGKVRLTAYRGWVDLEFSDYGVTRTDSNGYRDSISWSSLL